MNTRYTMISYSLKVILLIAMLPAATFSAHGETLYRWVDQQGRVTFQGSPPIKQEFTEQDIQSASGEVQPALAQPADIIFYAIEVCAACDQARQDLTQRGLEFTEINPSSDLEAGRKLLALFGKVEVPLLYIGNNIIKGYNPDWLDSELEKAGFSANLDKNGDKETLN